MRSYRRTVCMCLLLVLIFKVQNLTYEYQRSPKSSKISTVLYDLTTRRHPINRHTSLFTSKDPVNHSTSLLNSSLKWKFTSQPKLDDGSDGVLLSEKLSIPVWDVTAFIDPYKNGGQNGTVDLIIVVNSAVRNLAKRNLIRRTWGKDRNGKWRVLFLLGKSNTRKKDKAVIEESKKYQDMLIGDFIDNYLNNTIKTIYGHYMTLKWFKFKFLLKTDDDCYVNLPAIYSNLQLLNPSHPYYAGNVFETKAKRTVWRFTPESYMNTESSDCKWCLKTEEWPFPYHVRFARGMGSILSRKSVEVLIDRYRFVNRIFTDDTYVAYVLKRNGIHVCNLHEGFYESPQIFGEHLCKYANTYVIHYEGHKWPLKLQKSTTDALNKCTKTFSLLQTLAKCFPDIKKYITLVKPTKTLK